MDNTTVSGITRDFLAQAQKKDKVINITDDIPRAYILYGKKNERESVVVEETGVHVHNANLHSHSACWISCKTMDSNVSFAATLTIF